MSLLLKPFVVVLTSTRVPAAAVIEIFNVGNVAVVEAGQRATQGDGSQRFAFHVSAELSPTWFQFYIF